jgi:hypothetical protein
MIAVASTLVSSAVANLESFQMLDLAMWKAFPAAQQVDRLNALIEASNVILAGEMDKADRMDLFVLLAEMEVRVTRC